MNFPPAYGLETSPMEYGVLLEFTYVPRSAWYHGKKPTNKIRMNASPRRARGSIYGWSRDKTDGNCASSSDLPRQDRRSSTAPPSLPAPRTSHLSVQIVVIGSRSSMTGSGPGVLVSGDTTAEYRTHGPCPVYRRLESLESTLCEVIPKWISGI